MTDSWIAYPPVALAVMMLAAGLLSLALGRLAVRKPNKPHGTTEPYACGEESPDTMVRPDYGQFIPFAFFFTILHVVALMVTTAPIGLPGLAGLPMLVIAAVYIVGAIVGLTVLYRK